MKPGEYFIQDEPIVANINRKTIELVVRNRGDRPVQVGSHFHFAEVNSALDFDREKSLGMRLNIASGTAVRFEPGQTHTITLVEFGGTRTIYGFNNLVEGKLSDEKTKQDALKAVKQFGEQHG